MILETSYLFDLKEQLDHLPEEYFHQIGTSLDSIIKDKKTLENLWMKYQKNIQEYGYTPEFSCLDALLDVVKISIRASETERIEDETKASCIPVSQKNSTKHAISPEKEEALRKVCDTNPRLVMVWEEEYSFIEISCIETLWKYYKQGNWCVKSGILYGELAFVCVTPRDWWTLKWMNGAFIPFESCDMTHIAERSTLEEFLMFITHLSKTKVYPKKESVQEAENSALTKETCAAMPKEEYFDYYTCDFCDAGWISNFVPGKDWLMYTNPICLKCLKLIMQAKRITSDEAAQIQASWTEEVKNGEEC